MDCIKNYVNHQSIWVVMICNNFCFTNIARSISNIIYLACCFLNSVGTIQIRFHQIIFSNFSVLNLNKHQKHPQVLNSEVASFPAFRAFLSHRGYPQASSIFLGFRKPTSERGVPPMTSPQAPVVVVAKPRSWQVWPWRSRRMNLMVYDI